MQLVRTCMALLMALCLTSAALAQCCDQCARAGHSCCKNECYCRGCLQGLDHIDWGRPIYNDGRIMSIFYDQQGQLVPTLALARAPRVRAWLEYGTMLSGPDQVFPPAAVNDPQDSNSFQVKQFYLQAEKRADRDRNAFGVGYTAGALIGTDAAIYVVPGWDFGGAFPGRRKFVDYGIAVPKAFVSLYAPFQKGLQVDVGHFHSISNYEDIDAPENFFYSHSMNFNYFKPFTLSGAIATLRVDDQLTLRAGAITGWNDFNNPDGKWGYAGNVSWRASDNRCFVQASIISSDERQFQGSNQITDNRTLFSMLVKRVLTNRLYYVSQFDIGTQANQVAAGVDGDWYGTSHYAYYVMNDDVELGFRFGWFRDEDGFAFARNTKIYNATFGANIDLTESVVFRPEIRYDWSNNAIYNLATDTEILTVSLGSVFRF